MEQKSIIEDTNFLEKEDIISKIQFIQELEIRSPYKAGSTSRSPERYWDKIKRILESIPKEHHKAALSLFANVIYLPENLLRNAWEFLGFEFQRNFRLNNKDGSSLYRVGKFILRLNSSVSPAKAGIQSVLLRINPSWIPACAGMTESAMILNKKFSHLK
jgi:hypothetical protein